MANNVLYLVCSVCKEPVALAKYWCHNWGETHGGQRALCDFLEEHQYCDPYYEAVKNGFSIPDHFRLVDEGGLERVRNPAAYGARCAALAREKGRNYGLMLEGPSPWDIHNHNQGQQ